MENAAGAAGGHHAARGRAGDRAGVKEIERHGDDLALEARRARAHVPLEDVDVGVHPERLVHEVVVGVVAAVHGARALARLPERVLLLGHLAQLLEHLLARATALGKVAVDGIPSGIGVVVAHALIRYARPTAVNARNRASLRIGPILIDLVTVFGPEPRHPRRATEGGKLRSMACGTAVGRAVAGAALASMMVLVVPGPGPAYAASSVVALWHMDERSGSVMRDANGSHNGSLHSVKLGTPGYRGTAYGFTGSSYVSVPSAGDLSPGSKNITITVHLKATSTPAKPDWDLVRKGLYSSSAGEYKMEYQPSGQASCGFKGSSKYGELVAGPALDDGTWHTIQCVKTSSTIRLVVDGRAYSKTVTIGSISNSAALVIGARPGSEFFKGSLDEASIQVG